jgi:hypothetical protein
MKDHAFSRWLLEAETPCIRYLTSTRLLDLPSTDQKSQVTWEAMKTSSPIPDILAKQSELGSWLGERSFYTPKYTSTHWSMLLLSELAADRGDPRLERGVDFMLEVRWKRLEHQIEGNAYGWACFWANLLRYALHFGRPDDPRIDTVIALLVREALQNQWRCEYNHDRSCAWGAARTLWALAAIPTDRRSSDIEAVIQAGLTFLLKENNLTKADYPTPQGGSIHPLWFRLNFPLFYQTDILFVLRTLSELDELAHPGAQKALDWLQDRRGKNGQWRGSSPYRQRTWKSLGNPSETNRWVTLQAALVLKSAGRLY